MKKQIAAAVVLIICAVNIYGQFDWVVPRHYEMLDALWMNFEPQINDARAEALGKASVLSTEGSNNVFNNPAMLSQLEGKYVQISTKMIAGSTEIKADNSSYDGTVWYNPKLRMSSITFGMPVEAGSYKIGLGAGYSTYYDMSMDSDWNTTAYGQGEFITSGGFNVFALGGGISFDDKINLGFSANFSVLSEGEIESKQTFYNQGETAYRSTVSAEADYSGSFFTISGSYNYSENLSAGFRIRTPFELETKGSIKETLKSTDGNVNYSNTEDIEYEFKIPYEIGFSLKIKPAEKLNIYTEYVSRQISEFEAGDGSSTQAVWNNFSDDGYSIRTGFEVVTGEQIIISLRGGVFFETVTYYERKDDKAEDPVAVIGLTGGLGLFISESVTIDMFGSYSFIDGLESRTAGFTEVESVGAETTITRMKAGLTAGYTF